MRTIAVLNQKGGVGKTTTALNLAHALTLNGKQVTLMDLDPQAHLTASLNVDSRRPEGMDTVLTEGMAIDDVSVRVRDRLLLVPAGVGLTSFEQSVEGGARRGWLLRDAIKAASPRDFTLIDCPPSAGLLTMNALLAADELLIPVSGDYLALHGVSRLMETLQYIEGELKRASQKWVVLTRYHSRRRLAREVRDKLLQHFPNHVLATPVRENVSLAESPSFGQTVFEYQKHSSGADDYRALAGDLLAHRTCSPC